MIKGAVAELPICLRCQYRSSQPRLKTVWWKSPRIQAHARGLQQWRNLLESQAAAVAKDLDPDNTYVYHQGEEAPFENRKRHGDNVADYRRVRSFQAMRSKRQARKESLGVESLGAPAEALVLKEPQRDDPKVGVLQPHAVPVPSPADLSSTPNGLIHEVDSAHDIADMDQACANIDLLRQRFHQRQDLRSEEYEDLEKSLANGFQKIHLMRYLERMPPKTTADPSDIHKPFSSELYARSAWTPTNFSQPKKYHMPRLGAKQEDNPSHLHSRTGKHLPKSALVEAIIRSRWNLRRQQPISLNGTLFLRVRPAYLSLLLDHPRNPLKHIGEIFHTDMEAYRKEGVIRIVSNWKVAKEVLRVLIQLCESIGSRIVKLSTMGGPERDRALSNDYLSQVATLTNTIIHRNEKPKGSCTVLYLGPKTTDLDDVERLLKSRADSVMGHAGRSKEHLLYKPSSEPVCMVPIEHCEALPAADRSITWSRIAHPITSLDGGEVSKLPKKKVNIMRGPQSAAKRVVDFLLSNPGDPTSGASSPQDSKQWNKGLSVSTSAMLGYAAFQVHSQSNYSRSYHGSALERFPEHTPRTDSVFIPFVPGSMRSFHSFDLAPEKFEANEGAELSESLRLKMIPDPENNGIPQPWATTLPTLDIEVDIDRQTGVTNFKWARLVVHESVMHLMLPMRMLDIQFSRQSYLFNNEENIDPSLLDFVDASNLDILRSETLRTPNYLHIRIPGHALPRGENADRFSVHGLPMRYAFSNLEYRSSMRLKTRFDKQSRSQILPFSDHDVTFTHVEAGRLGGNREELVVCDLGDLISPEEDDSTNVPLLDALEDQRPTIDIDHLQDVKRTPDSREWIQKARALGPRGRARRLLKAALAVAGNVEPHHLGGTKT